MVPDRVARHGCDQRRQHNSKPCRYDTPRHDQQPASRASFTSLSNSADDTFVACTCTCAYTCTCTADDPHPTRGTR